MKNISPKIKVVGVGGSGGNAVLRMRKHKIREVQLIAMNTDYQDLRKSRADIRLRIGREITQGLGTGMKPKIGREAAQETRGEITEALRGADLVFITCGLGGGTGSGASPVIAEIAKGLGILTVAIVTLPFSFEGDYRRKIAQDAKKLLREKVDTLVTIENDKLLEVLNPDVSLLNAFWFCDDILREAVGGISDLIVLPGIVNVDFADVRSILKNSGTAIFAIGKARGEKRAEEAVNSALSCPLLNVTPKGAKGILFNVSGGKDISLSEIEEIGKIITKEVNSKAKIIFGAVQGEKLKEGEIKVTIIATGF
jgi:cell division protein FtsZ